MCILVIKADKYYHCSHSLDNLLLLRLFCAAIELIFVISINCLENSGQREIGKKITRGNSSFLSHLILQQLSR